MRLAGKFAAVAVLSIAASLAAQTPIRRHALTRAEIAAAVEKSLSANGLSAGPPLSPDDITMISPLAVTETNPTLVVTRIESRAGSNTTHVALWTTSEPRIPPFWVTVDRKLKSVAVANKRNADVARFVQPPKLRAPVLVHAGNPIQLIVQGAGMRIMTKGKALETGRAGQQIRVQTEPAGKILVAKIVTAQTAEIDY